MPFEVILGEDCVFVVSHKIQSAFGTRLADADFETGLGRRILLNAATMGNVTTQRAGGGPKAGSRTEHPVAAHERVVGHDSALSLAMDCESYMLGYALSHFFGQDDPTQEGTTGAWTHVFQLTDPLEADVGRAVPITSVYLDTGGPDETRMLRLLADLAVQSVTLSGRGNDLVSLAIEMPGSGLVYDQDSEIPVSVTPVEMPDDFILFANNAVKFEYGDRGGSLDEIQERLDTWAIRLNRTLALDKGYYPGSGYYRGRLWFLRRAFSLEFALFADRASKDLFDDMVGLTRKEIQITIDSGIAAGTSETKTHKLVLRYPDVRISEAPLAFNPEGQFAVRVSEDQVFLDAEDNESPCTATMVNEVPAYLVLAGS